ncbi:MAG: antitoxin HicB [Candidatus Doudnabacteria bacterium CG10_big_fil_rev_8_21_14_0_10_42_18]|uniref:Antitoxin HicB n=1 Tax=Candidatus Doudnabacteria bacterium CG10_big_fil_rev_8_21_14_0_10_42_18 TaxID=1974552 RepID=A0A2H0VE10_9BACT|nr:MAG: antitoxin HicB [Candidatus Doudnabacteria bacterium CG10_big_fil_rev_8_21_14_0_10_42_18]
MKTKVLNYNVVFTPEPEGGFTVTVPALRGCVTYGKTLIEAKAMAQEAIELMIETLEDHGEPIPTDNSLIAPMAVLKKIPPKSRTKHSIYA